MSALTPTSPVHRLAVIGSAGRGEDAKRVTKELYRAMYDRLLAFITELGTVEELGSGGAAFADHLAVLAFLAGKMPRLWLSLPASFVLSTGRFVEPYLKSPGSITNYHHRNFSRAVGGDSLRALRRALLADGCTSDVFLGFEERNAPIAAWADGVIAFTFGDGAILKDGGSARTMARCLARGIPSWHVCLPSMAIYSPAEVRAANGPKRAATSV